MKRRWLLWFPLALGLLLLVLLFLGLRKPADPTIVSRMVGQPLPELSIPPALVGHPGVASRDYKDGKPRLLNVFASYCLPCIVESPLLLRLQAMGVELDGVAVHDTVPDLQKFLAKHGNPYRRIGLDNQGRLQIAIGSSGVPETFVIDGKGTIVHQHIGVVTEADIPILLQKLGRMQ